LLWWIDLYKEILIGSFMGERGVRSAQVSMEYLIVVAFVFIIIMPFLIYFLSESHSTSNEINSAQLSDIARKIVENAEKVYAFGEPTTLTLQIYMPSNVESVQISGAEIEFTINAGGKSSTIVELFPMNVTGSISSSMGIHKLRLQAVEGYVNISEVV
jgi:uncharacterized protein (UPF0333 family)